MIIKAEVAWVVADGAVVLLELAQVLVAEVAVAEVIGAEKDVILVDKGVDTVLEKNVEGMGVDLVTEREEGLAEGDSTLGAKELDKVLKNKEFVLIEKGKEGASGEMKVDPERTSNWVQRKPEVGVRNEVEVIGTKGTFSRGRSMQKTPSSTPSRRRDLSKEQWDIAGNSNLRRDYIAICNRIKFLESQVDENSQRLRKATLIASSSDLRGLESELKKIQQDHNTNVSDLQKVLLLIKRKYGVEVDEMEIFANHWLQNGSYILKFVYRNTENSSWQRLLDAMRTGGVKNFNFYLNFNLTRKRLSLFKTVRKLKYDGKIALWNVDCNGTISIMHLNEQWRKLTHHYSKEGDLIPTYTDKAVCDLVN